MPTGTPTATPADAAVPHGVPSLVLVEPAPPPGKRPAVVPLHRPITLVGSRRTARLHLGSSTVSKAHCLLVVTPHGLFARDLGSRSGTFVNGDLVVERDLADGDEVKVGRFVFAVRDPRDLAGLPPPHRAPREAVTLRASLPDGGEAEAELNGGRTLLIGARAGADLHLPAAGVSTSHAVVVRLDGFAAPDADGSAALGLFGWHLYDLGGKGTRAAGRPVKKAALGDHAEFQVGPVDVAFDRRPLEVASPADEPAARPKRPSRPRAAPAAPADTVAVDLLDEDEALVEADAAEDLPRSWRRPPVPPPPDEPADDATASAVFAADPPDTEAPPSEAEAEPDAVDDADGAGEGPEPRAETAAEATPPAAALVPEVPEAGEAQPAAGDDAATPVPTPREVEAADATPAAADIAEPAEVGGPVRPESPRRKGGRRRRLAEPSRPAVPAAAAVADVVTWPDPEAAASQPPAAAPAPTDADAVEGPGLSGLAGVADADRAIAPADGSAPTPALPADPGRAEGSVAVADADEAVAIDAGSPLLAAEADAGTEPDLAAIDFGESSAPEDAEAASLVPGDVSEIDFADAAETAAASPEDEAEVAADARPADEAEPPATSPHAGPAAAPGPDEAFEPADTRSPVERPEDAAPALGLATAPIAAAEPTEVTAETTAPAEQPEDAAPAADHAGVFETTAEPDDEHATEAAGPPAEVADAVGPVPARLPDDPADSPAADALVDIGPRADVADPWNDAAPAAGDAETSDPAAELREETAETPALADAPQDAGPAADVADRGPAVEPVETFKSTDAPVAVADDLLPAEQSGDAEIFEPTAEVREESAETPVLADASQDAGPTTGVADYGLAVEPDEASEPAAAPAAEADDRPDSTAPASSDVEVPDSAVEPPALADTPQDTGPKAHVADRGPAAGPDEASEPADAPVAEADDLLPANSLNDAAPASSGAEVPDAAVEPPVLADAPQDAGPGAGVADRVAAVEPVEASETAADAEAPVARGETPAQADAAEPGAAAMPPAEAGGPEVGTDEQGHAAPPVSPDATRPVDPHWRDDWQREHSAFLGSQVPLAVSPIPHSVQVPRAVEAPEAPPAPAADRPRKAPKPVRIAFGAPAEGDSGGVEADRPGPRGGPFSSIGFAPDPARGGSAAGADLGLEDVDAGRDAPADPSLVIPETSGLLGTAGTFAFSDDAPADDADRAAASDLRFEDLADDGGGPAGGSSGDAASPGRAPAAGEASGTFLRMVRQGVGRDGGTAVLEVPSEVDSAADADAGPAVDRNGRAARGRVRPGRPPRPRRRVTPGTRPRPGRGTTPAVAAAELVEPAPDRRAAPDRRVRAAAVLAGILVGVLAAVLAIYALAAPQRAVRFLVRHAVPPDATPSTLAAFEAARAADLADPAVRRSAAEILGRQFPDLDPAWLAGADGADGGVAAEFAGDPPGTLVLEVDSRDVPADVQRLNALAAALYAADDGPRDRAESLARRAGEIAAEIALAVRQINQAQGELEEFAAQAPGPTTAASGATALRGEIESADAAWAEADDRAARLREELSAAQARPAGAADATLADLRGRLDALGGDLSAAAVDRAADLERRIDLRLAELGGERERGLQRLRGDLAAAEATAAAARTRATDARAALADAESAREAELRRSQERDELRSRVAELEDRLSALRAEREEVAQARQGLIYARPIGEADYAVGRASDPRPRLSIYATLAVVAAGLVPLYLALRGPRW